MADSSLPSSLTDLLDETGLLSSPAEEEFDRVTRLVRRLLGVPVSLVSLVSGDTHYIVSADGLPGAMQGVRTAPLRRSLCRYVVETGAPVIASDAREHPLLRGSEAVTALGAAAYAGIPLRTRDGVALGALCAIDARPREWADCDVAVLTDLAAIVSSEIDRRISERQRRRSEQALARAEERFRSLFGTTTEAVVASDAEGRIVLWNPGAENLFGYSADEVLGQPVSLVVPQGMRDGHAAAMRHHRDTGERHMIGRTRELSALHRDGREIPVEISLSSWTEEGQTFFGAFVRDISLRVRTERALRQAERDYHGLFDHAHDAILLLDPDDETVLDANRSACQLYGCTYQELVGSSLESVSTSSDGGQRFRDEVMRRGLIEGVEVVQRRRDGSLVTVEFNATVVQYRGRRVILSINRDVTLRKEADRAAREQDARFRAAFEDAGVGMTMLDMQGRVVHTNLALQAMVGYSDEELRGRHIREITHPDDVEANLEHLATLVTQGSGRYQLEKRYVHRDGHPVWVRVSASLVHDAQGRPEFVTGIVEDLTEQRQAEKALEERQRELLQAQKMEVVGRLAGGIAHDFNNLLTAIKGTLHLLLLDLPAGSPMREDLEEIDRAAARAAELTAQLLTFSRKQMVQPQAVDVNDVVARAERLLRRLIGEDIDFRTTLAPRLWRARADEGQVEQVLVNLVVNARDAMPQGGTLSVRTRACRVGPGDQQAASLGGGGDFVCVEVQDSGEGIAPENLSRIFDPFFTTKEVGKGTGLGLSTVYGIVTRAGGHVEVRSEPGCGALFRVYLPRAAAESADEPDAPEAEQPRTGTETVLLAEDEEVVRRLASRILRRAGYTVLEARDGTQALEVCEHHAGEIDLLLTDTVMPGLSGPELARRVVALRPCTRVLYTSGYTDDAVLRAGVQERGTAFIEKPFSPDDLLRRVRDTLGAPGGTASAA